MKKVKTEMEDDLRESYDLRSLRVRKFGSGRKNFAGTTVRLDPDVAHKFPNANAVNEALRFLIRVMEEKLPYESNDQPKTSSDNTSDMMP